MVSLNFKDKAINFIVRQRWRIAQTYIQILPLVGILNTFLYFLIFLGVTGVGLSINETLLGFTIILFVFGSIGYILDKIGYFKKDIKKSFSSATLDAYLIQADWNAIKIAYYSKFSKEELDEIMNKHSINDI
ncbi:hypothetical protein LCGC14_1287120 [marine sediment metagenome]|uniref:Uncharacterized protein n=1 Tax=marine sediment metagenome TaxID=412755 RepID=A0A0F9LEE9_9ZZZZ